MNARSVKASSRARRRCGRRVRDSLAQYGDADFDVVDALRTLAAGHGRPPAQIALAWLLSRAAVSAPVLGATKPHHIDDAIAALDITLDEEQTASLETPYRPHPVIGHN